MQYWWVNHGTSYKRELAGGYIWCPQVGDGDRRRESWEVMQSVKPGDLVVSHAKQTIQAVGVAQSAAFDWAVATTVQCNVAIGYLDGGHVDKSSTKKCDCFHGHLLALE